MRVKTEDRRQTIIKAAAEVFREHGFDRASMSQISERVGGSKATLYSYFKSKEELMGAVMLESNEDQAREVFSVLAQRLISGMDTSAELRTQLVQFGAALVSLIFSPEIIAMRRMVISQGDREGFSQIFFERGPKQGWLLLAAFLEKNMDEGKLRKASPWVAAMHFKALLESEYFDQCMAGIIKEVTPAMIHDATARAVDVFWRAYAAEPQQQNA